MEGGLKIVLCQDVLIPEEGKGCVRERGEMGREGVCDGMVKGQGNATGDDGVVVVVVEGKCPGDGDGWVGVGDDEDEWAR